MGSSTSEVWHGRKRRLPGVLDISLPIQTAAGPDQRRTENTGVARLGGELLAQELFSFCRLGVPLRELVGSEEAH